MGNAKKNRCNTPGTLSINVTAEYPKNLSSAGRWIGVHTGAVRTYVWLCTNVYVCITIYLREEHQPVIAIFNLVLNSNHIERVGKRVALGSAVVLPQSYKITMYAEPKLSFSEVSCFLMLGKLPLWTKLPYLLPTVCPIYTHSFWHASGVVRCSHQPDGHKERQGQEL